MIAVAITDSDAKSKAHGISLFIVEKGMPGFKKGRNLNKLGLKGHDTAELFFEDVRLPKTALLGGMNRGFYQLMTELPQERLVLGVASGMKHFTIGSIFCSLRVLFYICNCFTLLFIFLNYWHCPFGQSIRIVS